MKEIIQSDKAPKAIGPYSQAVGANGFVFVSGQIPIDPSTGDLVTGSIQVQTERVIESIASILSAAGLTLDDVVKTTVFLKDLTDFGKMNETYGKYFGVNSPARATVEVARLPRDVQVEIEVIAVRAK